MRVRKILQAAVDVPGTATTDEGAAIDCTGQNVPFMPNNTVVAAIYLAAAAGGTVRIQKSETAAGDDWETAAEEVFTTARTGMLFLEVTLGQRIRLQTEGTATDGAGAASLEALLGN